MNLVVANCSNRILNHVSLVVDASEVVSIIGPSGSGKTTLLRCIANLEPYTGTIRGNSNVGFVEQQSTLFPHLTVFDNIAYPLRLRKYQPAIIRQRVQQFLQQFNIASLSQRLPQAISQGEQQRVAIARALIYEPSVLLLDEPFAALDAITRYDLCYWLKPIIQNRRMMVVLVTHDIREARFFSQRLICLIKGQVVPSDYPQARELLTKVL